MEAVQHEDLRRELARLDYLLASISSSHSDPAPELLEMRDRFGLLSAMLEAHMIQKEEHLFSRCRALQAHHRWASSIQDTIRVMRYQHEDLLSTMAVVQRLAQALAPLEEVDTRLHAMREGLEGLDTALRQHIQQEEDLLFPKASAAEAAWSRRSFYHRCV
jgi:regulator of cell morphogenesis and NO signaling